MRPRTRAPRRRLCRGRVEKRSTLILPPSLICQRTQVSVPLAKQCIEITARIVPGALIQVLAPVAWLARGDCTQGRIAAACCFGLLDEESTGNLGAPTSHTAAPQVALLVLAASRTGAFVAILRGAIPLVPVTSPTRLRA